MAEINRICSIPGCNKPREARGWCWQHWKRWRRHGNPIGGHTGNGDLQKFIEEVAVHHDGDECLTWPFTRDSHGYAEWKRGQQKIKVHREVCARVHGAPPTHEHEAAHSCGKGHEGCISPKHLRWATHAENMDDKYEHGTVARGTLNGHAKLTEADARFIRSSAGRVLQSDLMEQFGVSQGTISDIQCRRTWGWIDDELHVRQPRTMDG